MVPLTCHGLPDKVWCRNWCQRGDVGIDGITCQGSSHVAVSFQAKWRSVVTCLALRSFTSVGDLANRRHPHEVARPRQIGSRSSTARRRGDHLAQLVVGFVERGARTYQSFNKRCLPAARSVWKLVNGCWIRARLRPLRKRSKHNQSPSSQYTALISSLKRSRRAGLLLSDDLSAHFVCQVARFRAVARSRHDLSEPRRLKTGGRRSSKRRWSGLQDCTGAGVFVRVTAAKLPPLRSKVHLRHPRLPPLEAFGPCGALPWKLQLRTMCS